MNVARHAVATHGFMFCAGMRSSSSLVLAWQSADTNKEGNRPVQGLVLPMVSRHHMHASCCHEGFGLTLIPCRGHPLP